MGILFKILIYAIGILVASQLLAGVHVNGWGELLVVAVVLIVLQTFLKPILSILTFPINFLTLGLFGLVVNAVIILIADALLAGFAVDNFFWALLFGLILSIIVSVLESFDKKG